MPAARRPRTHAVAALVVALALGLAACGPDDGRHLAEPDPDLTAVPAPSAPPAPVADADPPPKGVGPGGLELTSPDFEPGGPLPTTSACGGPTSPALRWTEPPGRITELALVVQDIDASGVAQWVVTGIPAEAGRVRPGEAPRGSDVRANSSAVEAWTSPCPQDGVEHRIVFTLYALDEPLPAGPGDATSVVTAVQTASAGSASLLARALPA